MRTKLTAFGISLVAVLSMSGAALASLTTVYTVTFETTMTPPNCLWRGEAMVTRSGTGFTGSANLHLVVDPDHPENTDPTCLLLFQHLSGFVHANLVGDAIDGTALFGLLAFHFIGVSTDGAFSGSGTWQANNTIAGLRVRGVWDAVRAPAQAPTLSRAALAILSLILFGVGARWVRGSHRDA